jgi:hypothetical protein
MPIIPQRISFASKSQLGLPELSPQPQTPPPHLQQTSFFVYNFHAKVGECGIIILIKMIKISTWKNTMNGIK